MRRERPQAKRGRPGQGKGRGASSAPPPQDALERARSLLLRLETSGPNPANAAEELDRLQGKLEREGMLEAFTEHVSDLCSAWAETPLRGERARAWLTLVGAFNRTEHTAGVAELAENTGLPAPLRGQACQVLSRLGGPEAATTLQRVLLSNTDAQVRTAAADGLAQLRDRSVRPTLEALLEEDLPRNVWNAVNEALDRLR